MKRLVPLVWRYHLSMLQCCTLDVTLYTKLTSMQFCLHLILGQRPLYLIQRGYISNVKRRQYPPIPTVNVLSCQSRPRSIGFSRSVKEPAFGQTSWVCPWLPPPPPSCECVCEFLLLRSWEWVCLPLSIDQSSMRWSSDFLYKSFIRSQQRVRARKARYFWIWRFIIINRVVWWGDIDETAL